MLITYNAKHHSLIGIHVAKTLQLYYKYFFSRDNLFFTFYYSTESGMVLGIAVHMLLITCFIYRFNFFKLSQCSLSSGIWGMQVFLGILKYSGWLSSITYKMNLVFFIFQVLKNIQDCKKKNKIKSKYNSLKFYFKNAKHSIMCLDRIFKKTSNKRLNLFTALFLFNYCLTGRR